MTEKLSDSWQLRGENGQFIAKPKSISYYQRFVLDRISVCHSSKCWLWQSSIHRDGYGKVSLKPFWQAHRVSYYAFKHYTYKENLLVLHRCHNRKCVNPEHLYQGTHKDNARDTIVSGRGRGLFKELEEHWNFKYSQGFVLLVQHLTKLYRNCDIARVLQIPAPTVSGIKNSIRGRYKS